MDENIDVFDFQLTDEEMAFIAQLDANQSSFFSHRDPKMVQWFSEMIEQRRNRG